MSNAVTVCRRLVGWGLAALAGTAAAQSPAAPPPAASEPRWIVFAEVGQQTDAHSLTAGFGRDVARRWSLGSGEVSARWEVSVGRWWIDERAADGPSSVDRIGVTPLVRWQPDQGRSPWFVEGGIGLNYIGPNYRTDTDRFATRWNFGDHLAVGRRIGSSGRHELSLRLSHFSNGGVREPNPGADFVQLRWAMRLP
ncbi:acyloxyacyl hydrolase [Aquabacterium sp. J223]|uniref:acyloxyacyl hydrolase n=1 Tax=Aquabacterium sp. J223 TaxID=2898431 RepID=UPI0021AD56E8|nr:acyloxyacyl hydrolase [Aquabacterium sp. J223]UUX94617.1 acyloxyacyl hydrolase [Aquabacterium sp. J223]